MGRKPTNHHDPTLTRVDFPPFLSILLLLLQLRTRCVYDCSHPNRTEVKNVHPSPLSPLSICYPTPSAHPEVVEDPASLASLPDPHVAELEEEQQQYHHHPDPEEDYHVEDPVDEELFQESLNDAGLPTRLLDFSTFRITGLRRSLEEGISGKYVTPERVSCCSSR